MFYNFQEDEDAFVSQNPAYATCGYDCCRRRRWGYRSRYCTLGALIPLIIGKMLTFAMVIAIIVIQAQGNSDCSNSNDDDGDCGLGAAILILVFCLPVLGFGVLLIVITICCVQCGQCARPSNLIMGYQQQMAPTVYVIQQPQVAVQVV